MDILNSREIVKSSAKILSAEVIINIFSVFYFILITRMFSKIEMSFLAVLSILTSIGVMFCGLGINPTIVKEIPKLVAQKEKIKVSAMIKSAIIIHLICAFIIVAVIYMLSKYISLIFFKTENFMNIIRIISINIISYKLFEDGEQLLTALQDFGKYSFVRICNGIFIKIVAVFGYFISGIEVYLIIMIICQFLVFCIIIFLLRKIVLIKSPFYSIKSLISYSLPFYGNAFSNFAAGHSDRLIVGVFLNPEQLAGYYVARRFLEYLSIISDAVMRPIGVKMAELKAYGLAKIESAFNKASRYISFIIIPSACFTAASAYPLLQIYGKWKYIDILPILVIFCLTTIPSAFYSLYVLGIYVIGEPRETFKAEFVRGLANISLSLLLIIPFNLLGVSIANFCAFLVACVFSHYLLKKLSKAHPQWHMVKDISIMAFIGCSVVIALQVLYYHLAIFLIYLFLGLTIFTILIWRKIDKDDLEILSSLMPKKKKIFL